MIALLMSFCLPSLQLLYFGEDIIGNVMPISRNQDKKYVVPLVFVS